MNTPVKNSSAAPSDLASKRGLRERIQHLTRAFRRDENGATAVEYGLIVGLIAIVIVGAVTILGGTLKGMFEDINTEIGGTSTAP
jgi:pilus assembly protein Flp/PilA